MVIFIKVYFGGAYDNTQGSEWGYSKNSRIVRTGMLSSS